MLKKRIGILIINLPKKEIVIKKHIDENILQIVELTYSYLINNDNIRIKINNIKEILIKLSMLDFFILEIYQREYIKKKKYESEEEKIKKVARILEELNSNSRSIRIM